MKTLVFEVCIEVDDDIDAFEFKNGLLDHLEIGAEESAGYSLQHTIEKVELVGTI